MSFTSDIKNEILTVKLHGDVARRAFVSALLRTCGAIEVVNEEFNFSATGDAQTIGYFTMVVKRLYKKECEVKSAGTGRVTATVVGGDCLDDLIDLGILKRDGDDVTVCLNIGDDLVADENTFKAYVTGAFLGSGSITLPKVDDKVKKKTGYHLEFVFSKYVTASDFCAMLAGYGLMPKLVERKGVFVVYFKSIDEIETVVGICGANSAFLKLTDVQIQKEIRNAENRKINCEMSNLNKTIDASIKQREDINLIRQTIGLESLKQPLKQVAVARLEEDDLSLQQLAEKLGITKSCLTHRLRKLSEISQSLK
ncbi:MAG: DNA-binding protein WhiA [Clostridia bacterium]|nr:DNA-binding protein WhiA [Clostridia bacterium]